jgi:hypothetical protein
MCYPSSLSPPNLVERFKYQDTNELMPCSHRLNVRLRAPAAAPTEPLFPADPRARPARRALACPARVLYINVYMYLAIAATERILLSPQH